MNTEEYTEPFPLDWNEWRARWDTWRFEQRHELQGSSYRFPREKNVLADAVLGVWSINGRSVELSEVTAPDFGKRPRRDIRYVGITFAGSGGDERHTDIAGSFAELELALGIGNWRSCDECGLITQASDAPDWPDGVCPNCIEHSRWRTEVVFDGALEDIDNYETREQAEARFTEHVDELHREHSTSHWRVDIYDEGDGLNPGQPVQSLVNDPEEEGA